LEVSPGLTSCITGAVMQEVTKWQNRPLEAMLRHAHHTPTPAPETSDSGFPYARARATTAGTSAIAPKQDGQGRLLG
jgi:hypothetical protein